MPGAGPGRVERLKSAWSWQLGSRGARNMKHCQVAVVGGGPAGLSAAIAAARTGASVELFDENPSLGGQLRYRVAELEVPPGFPRRPGALAGALISSAI